MKLWSTSSRTVLGFNLATGWLAPSLFEHEGSPLSSLTPGAAQGQAFPLYLNFYPTPSFSVSLLFFSVYWLG